MRTLEPLAPLIYQRVICCQVITYPPWSRIKIGALPIDSQEGTSPPSNGKHPPQVWEDGGAHPSELRILQARSQALNFSSLSVSDAENVLLFVENNAVNDKPFALYLMEELSFWAEYCDSAVTIPISYK